MHEVKEKPDLKQIQDKLINKLADAGWSSLLKAHLRSSEFENIIEFLINENHEGKRFTPALKQLFRAFEECPLDKVKVIMIGQDPYPYPLVADGLAFSCGNLNKAEASLRYIKGAIEITVPFENKEVVDENTENDLVRWSKQGVLLLNSALTTEIGKIGKHVTQWKPFMEYLIDMLNWKESGLVWVFMGKQAQAFESLVGDQHKIFTTTHPAYAAYIKSPIWDCNDVFNKINKQLIEYKKETIKW